MSFAAFKPTAGRSSKRRGDRSPALVLRVLTGVQKGAQASVRHERLLVGNLQSECDVVLEMGSPLPHSCLIRTSRDGWTVLSVAGNLWVGDQWVAPQQVGDIASGTVLTLGDACFCIADSTTIDWAQVQLPVTRATPPTGEPAPPRLTVASSRPSRVDSAREAPPPRPGVMQNVLRVLPHPRTLVLAGAVSLALVLLAGFGVSLYAASPSGETPSAASSRPTDSAQAALSSYPWARELTVRPDPGHADHVLVAGYLPERQHAEALESALRQQGVVPEHRWVAVDELRTDLSRRLGLPNAASSDDRVQYSGQGSFVVSDSGERFQALHRLVPRALQDLPAVRTVELRMPDRSQPNRSPASRPPIVVRYERAEGAPNGVAISGLERLRPAQELQRMEVNEVRTGQLPSVVLDNGTRYFEGASLPGGAVLTKVFSDHLMVRVGDDVRRVGLDTGLPIAAKKSSPAARIADAYKANPSP